MNVCLCSAFRDSASYLPRYLSQVKALRDALRARGDTLHLVWGEGDSRDNTWDMLVNGRGDLVASVIDVAHGGLAYGSIVHPQRFKQLAGVWNTIWQLVIKMPNDVVVFCESDLIWDVPTMLALIDDLADMSAVAPMVMDGVGKFYDVWAFRRNGQHFTNELPFYEWMNGDIVQLDSAGSCVAIRGPLARQLTWPEEDVIVGICHQIYELIGSGVWLDPMLTVTHP